MPRLTPAQQIARAEQNKKKAEEDIRRAQKKLRDADRSADARRKIILGAALLDTAKHSPNVAAYIRNVVAQLERKADKAVFDGFDLPEPERKNLKVAR